MMHPLIPHESVTRQKCLMPSASRSIRTLVPHSSALKRENLPRPIGYSV